MAWALGAEHIDEVVHRLESLIKLAPPRSFQDKLRMLPRLKEIADFMPRAVKKAACQETVLEPASLGHLPILTCWPQDGGPFITLGAVITRHPESGVRNVGIYRMQKFDDVTTGMHWQIHKVGAQHYRVARERHEIMHVAVAIGGPPVLPYAATAPLPEDLDEIAFAGFVQGQGSTWCAPGRGSRSASGSGDRLEGTVTRGRARRGPFGDPTGYHHSRIFPVSTDPSRSAAIRSIRRRSSAARRRRTPSWAGRRSGSSCRPSAWRSPRSST
jgi:4-hydroxy-3-polyprenylbenzoate decarboxylase